MKGGGMSAIAARSKGDIGKMIQRVLISMPDNFLKKIDNLANTEDRSRSELIREALRCYMKQMENK